MEVIEADLTPRYKDNALVQAALATFEGSSVEEVFDYTTGIHYKTGIKGGSKMSKIEGLLPKEWNGKKFVEASIDGKTQSIWQNWEKLKVGDEVTGKSEDKGNGRYQYRVESINGAAVGQSYSGGGYRGGGGNPAEKVRPFATSYAKDIIVALINKDDASVKTIASIKDTFNEFFDLFLSKMETETKKEGTA